MTDLATLAVLERGELEITGRLAQASNATFLASASLDGEERACVYKPVRGEKPLWDFPTGSLAGREVAAYLVSQCAGFSVVPPTTLGTGPYGPGMLQAWVEEGDEGQVDLVPEGAVPPGWRPVLDAYDVRDRPVTLVHSESGALRRMTLFDVVINNADRKGGHVLTRADGAVFGCDHGVSFHVENKLRTVLWGWAGEPLADDDVTLVERARGRLVDAPVAEQLLALISADEYARTLARLDRLLRTATFPEPGSHWPSIPWPAF